jgi:hypothetical protein
MWDSHRSLDGRRTRGWPRATSSILTISYVFLVILFVQFANCQDDSSRGEADDNTIPHHNNPYGCDCMEYWTCILSGGSIYSYCGIHAHDVCCFVPENAEPVGILPTPSRSRCGKKGFDSGHDGDADMAEWPWHVRKIGKNIFLNIFLNVVF